jgi:hypothetical protein
VNPTQCDDNMAGVAGRGTTFSADRLNKFVALRETQGQRCNELPGHHNGSLTGEKDQSV